MCTHSLVVTANQIKYDPKLATHSILYFYNMLHFSNFQFSVPDGLVKLEQQAHTHVVQLRAGRKPKGARKRTSILNDARIVNLTDQLTNHHDDEDAAILRFLNAVSHLMDPMIDEILRAPRVRPRRQRRGGRQ